MISENYHNSKQMLRQHNRVDASIARQYDYHNRIIPYIQENTLATSGDAGLIGSRKNSCSSLWSFGYQKDHPS
jgi:hypothetical protein